MGIFKKMFGKKEKQEKTFEDRSDEFLKPEEKKEAPAPKKETKEAVKASPAKVEEKAEAVVKTEKKTAAPKKEAAPKAEVKKAAPKKASAPKAEEPKDEIEDPSPDAKKDFSAAYTGCFEIKKSKDERYVFNLYASNHVIVATSQVYSSSQSALTGIKSVIANAEKAQIEDQTLKTFEELNFPKWEIYKDKAEQFRFRLSASNGSCICHSQGYTTKSSCKNGIESVKKSVQNAEIDRAYLKKED